MSKGVQAMKTFDHAAYSLKLTDLIFHEVHAELGIGGTGEGNVVKCGSLFKERATRGMHQESISLLRCVLQDKRLPRLRTDSPRDARWKLFPQN
jgi:hypothetical protein